MFKEAERVFAEEQERIRKEAVWRVSKRVRKGASKEELEAFSKGFLSELDNSFALLDSAAKECVLPEDSRVYRMVDKSILSWGFGIKNYESMTPSQIVDQINQHHGKLITDHSYMSTGYCLSQYFHKSPFMLTLLTPKGKQCYVTANFEEAEIIFGRDTTYSVVCAVDHSEEPKEMKISSTIPDGAQTVDEIRTKRAFSFKGIEIICKME